MARERLNWFLSPEVFEPIGRHFGVSHRVLDILVAEVMLQRAGVVAVIGQLEAAGVPQHVWMDGKRHLGGLAEPYHEMMEAHRADWSATLGNEHMGFARVLTPQLAQRADLIATNRMDARRAVLGSADMQPTGIKLDLLPFQVAHLRSP
jgi:hypothetical protein